MGFRALFTSNVAVALYFNFKFILKGPSGMLRSCDTGLTSTGHGEIRANILLFLLGRDGVSMV